MSCARQSRETHHGESIWKTQTAFPMARHLERFGRFMSAKERLVSNVGPASVVWRMEVDQPIGARDVNEDDNPQITQIQIRSKQIERF